MEREQYKQRRPREVYRRQPGRRTVHNPYHRYYASDLQHKCKERTKIERRIGEPALDALGFIEQEPFSHSREIPVLLAPGLDLSQAQHFQAIVHKQILPPVGLLPGN